MLSEKQVEQTLAEVQLAAAPNAMCLLKSTRETDS